jgi:hydrogenase expression/formation protein HypE
MPMAGTAGQVLLAHGEGARLSRRLIRDTITSRFRNSGSSSEFGDAAVRSLRNTRIAVTTDSYTVSPLFFPGGDIGSLSIYGTVNDLVVAGAEPRWLTFSLMIEEGLPLVVLEAILDSASEAARRCSIEIVAGDTKVVPRGCVDQLFINTAGVGELVSPAPPGPAFLRPGDSIVVSGDIGRHGIAMLNARGILQTELPVKSDSGSVQSMMHAVQQCSGNAIRCVRDATRGGVSAVLHEWSEDGGVTISLEEHWIPVRREVRGACEILGLDPLYIANEGTIVIAVDSATATDVVDLLRLIPGCERAAVIGKVCEAGNCPVTIRRAMGIELPLDEPSGAPLPRIC